MSLRPQDPKRITNADLVPGDVILSCGPSTDPLDTLIKLIDQGDYSHTSLYIGLNPDKNSKLYGQPMVVEATKAGIMYDPISVDLGAQDLVDVYRYVSPDGHHLGDPGWPAQPILDRAMSFVGADYAYDELMLGAVVLFAAQKSSGNVDVTALLRMIAMLATSKFVEWLNGTKSQGKTPMTCVEVATTAFWQGDPVGRKYALQVQLVRSDSGNVAPMALQRAPAQDDLKMLEAKTSQLRDAIARVSPKHVAPVAKPQGGARMAAMNNVLPPPQIVDQDILGLVTPRDMETSPTLKFVGCLQDKNAPGKR